MAWTPVMTADEVNALFGRDYPQLNQPVALEAGLGFAVREGNRTVAAGTVAELLD